MRINVPNVISAPKTAIQHVRLCNRLLCWYLLGPNAGFKPIVNADLISNLTREMHGRTRGDTTVIEILEYNSRCTLQNEQMITGRTHLRHDGNRGRLRGELANRIANLGHLQALIGDPPGIDSGHKRWGGDRSVESTVTKAEDVKKNSDKSSGWAWPIENLSACR